MTAALSYSYDHHASHEVTRAPALRIPEELDALFEESAKVKGSFWRLSDRDRRGFVHYVEQAKTTITRERRAAIVAMSLIGLAADVRDDRWREARG